MALLKVRDECTKLVGHRFLNSHICLVISLVQLLVCCWAFAQHVNSYFTYSKILKCDFLEGSLPLEAVDAVIFDIRLFHNLWGIRGCVAEYLDGGFGRLAWCVSHSTSLICSLPNTFRSHPKPCYFWPLLVQQSAYGVCLLVLLLAALPRIVVVLAAPEAAPLVPILFYFTGTALNFFHLYVYWHWYWHVTAMWNSAVRVKFGEKLVNANNRSRRDKPRLPKEEIDDEVLHYVPGSGSVSASASASGSASGATSAMALRTKDEETPKIILPPDSTITSQNNKDSPTSKPINTPRYQKNRRRQKSVIGSNYQSHNHTYHQNQYREELLAKNETEQPKSNNHFYQNGFIPRRVEETIIVDEEYEDDGDESDIDDISTPPMPLYATRLTYEPYENRRIIVNNYDHHSNSNYFNINNRSNNNMNRPRRQLPKTPNLPMHGELPRVLYLPNAHV